LSAKRVDYYQTNGLHPRSFTKGKHQTEVLQTRIQKHRYVYLVGDRKTKKQMRKCIKYPIFDKYPKGDEKHYDINNPQAVKHIQIIDRKKPYKARNTEDNNEHQNS
jgi:hypothetical protein